MLTALVSAKSDGVTTSATAMALASSRPVLLAELDLSGGTLRHGLLQHSGPGSGRVLDGQVGLHRLPRADWARQNESDSLAPAVDKNLWPLDGSDSRVVLPGLTSPQQAASLGHTWPELINVFQLADQHHGFDVLADCGRLIADRGRLHPALNPVQVLHQADTVLLVVRSTEASVALAQPAIQVLRQELAEANGDSALGLLVVEEGAHAATEVAEALQVPLLAVLPFEPGAAAYATAGGRPPRGFAHSRLMRSARSYGDQVREGAHRRRLHIRMGAAQALSPQVASVALRVAQQRGATVRSGG